ncbi:PREDICTED: serine/threonine-protein kinase pelle isoform X3 [Papilio xuthus]|uniref:non-specific serine/threonine protein kinase n=1 Tax=Papilio xuthus TaxID=66420 RepID=A0AAJ6Z5B1_PAPXU|nr:PREDICTED: serine/threonine-protein kinase pelle isoform X1 [Papilio xuthus]XP_013165669.1 PREDICTED: serine/threonine-protein kinase pelle isoform X3 [Papilio xuthus]
MYIYELPFEVNKELCRLLDNDEEWKELAGVHMKYSPFDVNEIEREAKNKLLSPTAQLFIKWGQLNHRVEELFILLYRMKHVPALRCLVPVVDSRFHRLLSKHDITRSIKSKNADNDNVKRPAKMEGSNSSIPIPVMLMQNGISNMLPNIRSIEGLTNGDSSLQSSSNNSSSNDTKPSSLNDELIKKISTIPMVHYEELKAATDNWSESNLLGKGGFGQVYKGVWKLSAVAVKRLLNSDSSNNRELIGEMCLNQYRHDNILPLYGYSLGGPEACLVYQYMSGGSLEKRLRCRTGHPPLTWPQRYKIAHGVARGLQYLHTMEGTPLIHGDIKPGNILLDQCIMPKIGDFGLARKGPYGEDRTHMKVSRVHGTRPYLPDEYLRSHYLSPAVDVFSYGVVMLELATALPVMDRTRTVQLLRDYIIQLQNRPAFDLASLEDRNIQGTVHSNPALCREIMFIGLHCTRYDRHERPAMLHVYKQLDSMHLPEEYYN